MTRLNVSKAREEFPEVVNRAAYGKERTIVSRRGKDLAAVIPIEDLRLLERLAREEMDRLDLEDSRAALAEPGENTPLEVVKKKKPSSIERTPCSVRPRTELAWATCT